LVVAAPLWGIPTYARRFSKSCIECHVGYPKLNYEAENFRYDSYIPQNYNPRMKTFPFRKDERIYLPMNAPISFRFKAFMGLLADSSKLSPKGDVGGAVFLSWNLSSISSFYVAAEYGDMLRNAFLSVKLPFRSRLLVGRYDLSEFFVKRTTRLTYYDLVPYTRANLYGTGVALSFTPYFQIGMYDVSGARTFIRAGANTKYFGFGIMAVPVDGAQRYALDLRVRFAFFDLFTTTVVGLNQKLGNFNLNDSTAFITGDYGLDLTFGRFYTSLLYNYVGALQSENLPSDHLSMLTWALGFYPVSNAKVSLELGYNFAARFPADGTYGGLVIDWSF